MIILTHRHASLLCDPGLNSGANRRVSAGLGVSFVYFLVGGHLPPHCVKAKGEYLCALIKRILVHL